MVGVTDVFDAVLVVSILVFLLPPPPIATSNACWCDDGFKYKIGVLNAEQITEHNIAIIIILPAFKIKLRRGTLFLFVRSCRRRRFILCSMCGFQTKESSSVVWVNTFPNYENLVFLSVSNRINHSPTRVVSLTLCVFTSDRIDMIDDFDVDVTP